MRSFYIFILLLCFPFQALAHKVTTASAIIYLDPGDKESTFRLSVAMEVESSQDQEIDDKISPEQAAKTFVEENLQVLIDQKEQPQSLEVEMVNMSDDDTPKELRKMAVLVEWKGKVPPGGKELLIFLDESSDLSVVLATVKNGVAERRGQIMFPGEFSRPKSLQKDDGKSK